MTQATGTVNLHRVLRAPPERIYNAFLNPDAMVKWLPPHGHIGKVHYMDAQVAAVIACRLPTLVKAAATALAASILS